MWGKRLSLGDEQSVAGRSGFVGGFMAVPASLLGATAPATFQQQLYQWAFEQARQAMPARRPAPMRDLFAIMN
jgi:hypothetical protein